MSFALELFYGLIRLRNDITPFHSPLPVDTMSYPNEGPGGTNLFLRPFAAIL
jgi:hypothetical protein